ncbi:type III-B CRISPR module-associated protein Cmr5 [uncultured Microscilla sp.]|uniref:type III-B CRISPR module-associated protein Cmr5 n=1 Tax=uncultured Microscilla sp. TaxID=432653 RepID=UPI0026305C95|nr:type III-B CRISPR module-associated protein Cmr5 [uncultured Microscilla sp.]
MSQQTLRTTLEQGRAAFAFECAQKGMQTKGINETYEPQTTRLPTLIKTNGLGAAIAFFASNKPVHKHICLDILSWLQQSPVNAVVDMSQIKDVMGFAEKITQLDTADYKTLTIEVLAFLTWLRRFAKGLDKQKDNERKNKA